MKRKLSELTDYEPEVAYDDPVTGSSGRLMIYRDEASPKEEKPSSFSSSINNILNQLFRPDEKRYQLWPEKIIREGLTAAGDVVSGKVPTMALDPVTGEVHTSPEMIEKAQAISALAGTGGLAGGAEGAALNATPSLRPALKHKERLYKGKPGQEHQDIIPKELYDDFSRKAMSGEDLVEYNFGFINDKGHFLNREDALKYGIDTGLIDPHSGRFGALTTTLMADSSKPGVAIESIKISNPLIQKAKDFFGITRNPKEAGYVMPDGSMLDFSGRHYADYKKVGDRFVPQKGSDYLANQRNVDHRELHDILDAPINKVTGQSDNNLLLSDFMQKTGAIRNQPGIGFEASVMPTDKQLKSLVSGHNSTFKGEPLKVDLASPSGEVYASFDFAKPNVENIKKWISTTIKHDSSKPGTAIEAMKVANPFFSAVEHTVKGIQQNKMNGEAWLGTLANKPGVKPEELDWIGLRSFLEENKGKPVTKQQIEEHIASNKVELKEVLKTDKRTVATGETIFEAQERVAKEEFGKSYTRLNSEDRQHVDNFLKDMQPTKYQSYQLPGGENYREMLLTLPPKAPVQAYAIRYKDGTQMGSSFASKAEAEATMKELFPNRTDLEIVPEKPTNDGVRTGTKPNPNDYRSSHWDEPNILAHVRMNDRTIDGKKSLHLEEIQSDWHQQGRDKGYTNKGELEQVKKDYDSYEKDLFKRAKDALYKDASESGVPTDRVDRIYEKTLKNKPSWKQSQYLGEDEVVKHKQLWDDYQLKQAELSNKVPDAPFKKSWHELALKRMIREAAEKGYDRLSWTPGEAQAARYDLSKQVDKIAVPMVNKDGTRSVRIDAKGDTPFKLMVDKNGIVDGSHSASQFSGKPLSDVVGKEMAEKIMKLDKSHEFSGEGLKIGGEGMKGFYDQIIPKALEKLGKEHGVKVQKGTVETHKGYPEKLSVYDKDGHHVKDFDSMSAAREYLNNPSNGVKNGSIKGNKAVAPKADPIFYIDIPQSLRDTAMRKGFPLFSNAHPGYTFIPVDDPFKD